MSIRCIIVDDEPLAREGMELLVKEAGFLDLRASCCHAMEANKILAQEEIDLIFLDIQMPKIRGIDFLRSLTTRPLVVITTAYPNFALEGFELNVLDYLVKPITPERFLRSANRARELLEYRQPSADNEQQENYFFIKCNNGYEKIFYAEILFIEACQNYSSIHTTRGKFMTLSPMRALEEQLPPRRFLRVQKSYIVSLEKVQSLSGNEITIDKQKIPVSKNYKEELMKIIDRKLIKK
jgi:DNA-binding LytR/AlgR family response regulator